MDELIKKIHYYEGLIDFARMYQDKKAEEEFWKELKKLQKELEAEYQDDEPVDYDDYLDEKSNL